MDAAQRAELDAWVDQYVAANQDAVAQATLGAWAAYQVVDDWYNPDETLAAAAEASGLILSVLQLIDGLAAQFEATAVAVTTRTPIRRAPRPPLTYPRHGADVRQVYDRPIWTYRDTIARGGTDAEAFTAARTRAMQLAETDIMLAERHATIHELDALKVTHYRRVIRPELSETGTCGLCIAASQMLYTIDVLLPIHDRCKCTVLPVVNGEDPAGWMNTGDLERFYDDAGSKKSRDLKRTRYRVDEHGELGPVLTPRKGKRVDKAPPPDDTTRAKKELAALLPVLDSLESRAAAGEDVSGPLAYQRDRIAKLRSIVAE